MSMVYFRSLSLYFPFYGWSHVFIPWDKWAESSTTLCLEGGWKLSCYACVLPPLRNTEWTCRRPIMWKHDVIHKPEVHNESQCQQSRTEPRPEATRKKFRWSSAVWFFLPRDAMQSGISRCRMSVRLSVRHTSVLYQKRLNTGSRKQRHTIVRHSSFLMLKIVKFERRHPNGGAKCRWSRLKWGTFGK